MKHIISAFGILFVLMINIFICIGTATASSEAAVAKEYKSDVISEIENSNFNPNVIAACISEAQSIGYQLQITESVDINHEIQSAEVILSYTYKIPIFGISQTKTTRGIAR